MNISSIQQRFADTSDFAFFQPDGDGRCRVIVKLGDKENTGPHEALPCERSMENTFSALVRATDPRRQITHTLPEPKVPESVVVYTSAALGKVPVAEERTGLRRGLWDLLCSCCKKKSSSGASA